MFIHIVAFFEAKKKVNKLETLWFSSEFVCSDAVNYVLQLSFIKLIMIRWEAKQAHLHMYMKETWHMQKYDFN